MAYSFPLMLISLITGLLYFYIVMFFVTPLKYSIKKTIVMAITSIAINLILTLFLVLRLHVGITDRIFLFTIPFIAFWFQASISSVHGFKLMFLYFTVYWLNILIFFCTSLLFVYWDDGLYFLVQFYVFILVCFYVLYFFRKPFFKILAKIHHGWPNLMIIPLSFSVILLRFNVSPFNPTFNMDYLYVNMLIFALAFTVYAVLNMYFINSSEFFDMKQCNDVLVMQSDFQYKSFTSINQTLSDFEVFKGDMNAYLITISSSLSNGCVAEAKDYILNIQEDIGDFSLERFCTNYMVNTIISSYVQKARDENISVYNKLNIPEDIHIDNLEICVIFSNAIENAINACRKITYPEKRFLSIGANILNEKLFIKISNPCIDDVNFVGDAPVSSKSGHGFGTKSIISIAKKYDGFYSFEVVDDIFNMILVL